MDVKKGDRVVFVGPKKTPYHGVVQRITGQMVTVRATGLMPGMTYVVDPVAQGTLHIVHRDGVAKI